MEPEGLVRIKASFDGVYRRVTVNAEGLDLENFQYVIARLFEISDFVPQILFKYGDQLFPATDSDMVVEQVLKAQKDNSPLRCYISNSMEDIQGPARNSIQSEGMLTPSMEDSIYLPFNDYSGRQESGGVSGVSVVDEERERVDESVAELLRKIDNIDNIDSVSEDGDDIAVSGYSPRESSEVENGKQEEVSMTCEEYNEVYEDGMTEKLDERALLVIGGDYTRGALIGRNLGREMLALFELKRKQYAGRMSRWKEIADKVIPSIEMYAPLTYREMIGTSVSLSKVMEEERFETDEHATSGLDIVILLATEYEMSMDGDERVRHCSSFSVSGDASVQGKLIAGQNNDETPDAWFEGKLDRVIVHHNPANERTSVLYTHPGMPSYMGMNCSGLCVCWTYIDNAERCDEGVPTTVLLRELLHKKSVHEACEYLRMCPKTLPNYFHLSQDICGNTVMLGIEASPSHFTVLSANNGQIVHTNHILWDQSMEDNDVGILRPTTTTVPRYKKFRALMKENHGKITRDIAGEMLRTMPIHNDHTLVSIVFSPESSEALFLFKGENDYRMYNLSTIKGKLESGLGRS